MAEAGFGPDNPLKTEFQAFSFSFFTDAAQVVKEQLKRDLGMELDLTVTETPTFFANAFAGNYTISLSGLGPMITDPDDRFQALYTGKGTFNISQWSDPEVDRLFDLSQRERDIAKRIEISHEMQRLTLLGAPGTIEFTWVAWPIEANNRIKTSVGHYVVSNSIQNIMKHEHEWLEPK